MRSPDGNPFAQARWLLPPSRSSDSLRFYLSLEVQQACPKL